MYEFIVGGFIPGTNIQMSFEAYILSLVSIALISLIIWIEFNREIKAIYNFIKMVLNQLYIQLQLMAQWTAHKVAVLPGDIASAYSPYLLQAHQAVKNILPSERNSHQK